MFQKYQCYEREKKDKRYNSRSGYLNLSTVDILGKGWGLSVHCRMLSSLPDLYPLDAGSSVPNPYVTTNKQLDIAKCSVSGGGHLVITTS